MPKRYKAYKLADWTVVTLTTVNELQHALRTNIASFTGLIFHNNRSQFIKLFLLQRGQDVEFYYFCTVLC